MVGYVKYWIPIKKKDVSNTGLVTSGTESGKKLLKPLKMTEVFLFKC